MTSLNNLYQILSTQDFSENTSYLIIRNGEIVEQNDEDFDPAMSIRQNEREILEAARSIRALSSERLEENTSDLFQNNITTLRNRMVANVRNEQIRREINEVMSFIVPGDSNNDASTKVPAQASREIAKPCCQIQ